MQYVSLASFCERTRLSEQEVKTYEAQGIIRGTTKDKNQFYSVREAYRIKGILYFIRTQGLSPEEAAVRIDQEVSVSPR